MTVKIAVEQIASKNNSPGVVNMMPGAVEGVTTQYIKVHKGKTFFSKSMQSKAMVILFLKGSGVFHFPNNKTNMVSEIALLATVPACSFHLKAEYSNVEFLEIIVDLSEDDLAEIGEKTDILPYILKYSDATCYREDIKSAKTINRTLLPVGTIPRLTIGSVETMGPDKVAAHQHPMLEQFFFGLPGNNCRVFADDQEVDLQENSLLHIPSGSLHGAYVNDGNLMHYLWIDLFKNKADMSYIEMQHQQIEKKEMT